MASFEISAAVVAARSAAEGSRAGSVPGCHHETSCGVLAGLQSGTDPSNASAHVSSRPSVGSHPALTDRRGPGSLASRRREAPPSSALPAPAPSCPPPSAAPVPLPEPPHRPLDGSAPARVSPPRPAPPPPLSAGGSAAARAVPVGSSHRPAAADAPPAAGLLPARPPRRVAAARAASPCAWTFSAQQPAAIRPRTRRFYLRAATVSVLWMRPACQHSSPRAGAGYCACPCR